MSASEIRNCILRNVSQNAVAITNATVFYWIFYKIELSKRNNDDNLEYINNMVSYDGF